MNTLHAGQPAPPRQTPWVFSRAHVRRARKCRNAARNDLRQAPRVFTRAHIRRARKRHNAARNALRQAPRVFSRAHVRSARKRRNTARNALRQTTRSHVRRREKAPPDGQSGGAIATCVCGPASVMEFGRIRFLTAPESAGVPRQARITVPVRPSTPSSAFSNSVISA